MRHAPGRELAMMHLSLDRAVGRMFNGVGSQKCNTSRLVCFTVASIELLHLNSDCQSFPFTFFPLVNLCLSLSFFLIFQ